MLSTSRDVWRIDSQITADNYTFNTVKYKKCTQTKEKYMQMKIQRNLKTRLEEKLKLIITKKVQVHKNNQNMLMLKTTYNRI